MYSTSENKVTVINVITAPKIEMLIIHNEGEYERFKRSGKKRVIFVNRNFVCMTSNLINL